MQGLRLLHSSFKKNIKEGPQFAAKIVYVLFDPKYVPLLSLLPPFSNFIRIEPTYKFFFIFIIIGIFILLSREKATKRCMSSLRSCRSSVYHTKMGEFRYVPFPKAQQVNLPAFSTLSLNAERQAGKL